LRSFCARKHPHSRPFGWRSKTHRGGTSRSRRSPAKPRAKQGSQEPVASEGQPTRKATYPDNLLQEEGFRLKAQGFRLQASDFRLQTSGFRLQTSGFRLQASDFRLLPSAFRLPPSAFCLPPSSFLLPTSAFRLPPSAFRLPPSAFCLLPSAFCLACHFPPFARPNGELQWPGQKTAETRPGETPRPKRETAPGPLNSGTS
jgi:hypothetical protein